jgi:hypothetical protein
MYAINVGAGAACDLLTFSMMVEDQDQKIAACGSSYKVQASTCLCEISQTAQQTQTREPVINSFDLSNHQAEFFICA